MNKATGPQNSTSVAGAMMALLLFSVVPCFGQIDRGVIVGTVNDSSGAVVPGATVTVTKQGTGVAVTTQTNSAGQYEALALIPGTYTVKVSAQGFSNQLRDGVQLHVQDRLSIDFTLRVGSVQQEIHVTALVELLNTQTADVGNVVDARQVNDLPLNGRRYADLALLQPGVQKYYAAANPAPDRFSSNGNLELQNDFLLDGIANNSGSENLQEFSVQVVQPPPDALQEFKVQTRTYSSEFGASAGAVVNATIKSGTNQFHGNLWEFNRNDDFGANTFFNNKNGVPIGHFVLNQLGGTIGGPIKKDKAFFFYDMQDLKARQTTTINSIAPTPLMKQGIFTEWVNPSKGLTLTPSPVAGQANCVSGDSISNACMDPVAMKLAALFPDPNIPSAVANEGKAASWTGAPNYQFPYSVPSDTWSLDGRIDENLNQKNRIFGRYSYYHVSRQDPPWTSNPVAGNGNFATQYRIHGQQVALSWTDTLSNSMLNELRLGFSRDFAHSDPIGLQLGTSLAPQFGLTGVPVGPNTAGIPPISISGLTRLGSSPWRPQYQISQEWEILDSLNWLEGKHSFKFGYELLHTSDNFLDIRSPQGEIPNVAGIYTASGKFGLPDFILGDLDQARFTTPLVAHNYQVGHSWYGQDTWRMRPNLTVTYGLRYELFSPWLNHQNQESNFTPANGGGIVAVASNASGWYARSLIHPDYNNFAPRVGFSYHPWQRVVFRGGYGVFYQPFNRIGSESIEALNRPWITDVGLSQSLGTNTPVFFLQAGFPLSTLTGTALPLSSLQIRAQDPNQRTSYVEQLSFGPEYQLSNNTVLDLTYVGNFGRKLNRLRNANQGIVTAFNATGSPIVAFPFTNLNTTTLAVNGAGQHAFLELATNDGNSNYHALEVSLRRTFTKGLGFGVNYTWSHNLANFVDNLTGGATPQNAYNYGNEMSNSILDVQQRLVSNFVWQLPFGKGQRFLSDGGWGSKLAGGWQFNTIITIQSGFPFSVTAADKSGTGGNHAAYANCIGNAFSGAASGPGGPNGYLIGESGSFINLAAFAVPSPGQFGSCAPRLFHGPGLGDADLSLFRNFRLSERKRLEFRSEFFNAFNHPNFANPSASLNSPGSFGKVSSTIAPILGQNSGGPGDPREIQFALKLYF